MPAGVVFAWFAAAVVFILGLRSMSSPVTARAGIRWAGAGMLLAVAATFAVPGLHNFGLMLAALGLGGGLAWTSGRRVALTAMPQMVAIYNGLGGGAAACIAAVEFARAGATGAAAALAALGALVGAVSFTGSAIAFLKLQGLLRKPLRLPGQNAINGGLTVAAFALAGALVIEAPPQPQLVAVFFVVCLVLGAVVTLPIGGADMPVVISLFNAFTGLAVGFEGYVLANPLLIIAGIVVGAAGTLLTQLMAKAMNRSLGRILFIPLEAASGAEAAGEAGGSLREISAADAAAQMRYANQVVVVPGYGMAVAHAQHKVWEMAGLLEAAGVRVKFAIHPVAGRMPGHMNVLLAEAGVPYDKIFDLDEINAEFAQTDVALVIGANDVVNPVARTDRSSPIYGMPILNVDQAQNVIVIKRGQGTGYSGVDNALFYREHCRMLYGNAQPAVAAVVQHLKTLA